MLSKGLGGIEQVFVDYLTAFDNLGHKSVGIMSRGAKIMEKLPSHIQVESIFNFGEWDILASWKIKTIIEAMKPDVIITHGRRAAKLVKPVAQSIPVVGVAHNYSLDYLLELDYILSITQDLKSHLVNLSYPETKIFHIPNMINSSAIKLGTTQIKFRNPPVIGAMGRFVKKKGLDLFIQALSILKDEGVEFQAIIAGNGEEEANLKALTKALDLQGSISFPGWVTDKDQFFSSIDIFCLPSTHEPFGIILLEAFCHNKPVVSFKSEGPSEIGSDNKTLLFAELGNARDLAEKLQHLLTTKALAPKLAQAGRDLIKENYSLDVVQQTLNSCVKHIHSHNKSKVET